MTYEEWADTHQLQKVIFWWKTGKYEGECTLYDKTYNEATKVAKEHGFKVPRWFKPWTWANGVITVG